MLAAYLDSTNLKPDARQNDISILCEQAAFYRMAAVCINPYYVKYAAGQLRKSDVKVCTVIGFPLGNNHTGIKIAEAVRALEDGAAELDMVINIAALKDDNWSLVGNEIEKVLKLKNDAPFILKVIVETALLSREELAQVTCLLSDIGADYIKTSTGFASRGVSLEDIDIINRNKSSVLKIKASGGIRKLDFAMQLINAGVDRIGCSSAVDLLQAYQNWRTQGI